MNYKFILSIVKNQEFPNINFGKCHNKTIYINCVGFSGDYYGKYSLIYNNKIQDYDLIINDNFTETKQCNMTSGKNNDYFLKETDNNEIRDISNSLIIIPDYPTNKIDDEKEKNIEKITTKESKEEILNNIPNFIKDKEIGKNYQIIGDDFSIIIKPTNSTAFQDSTHVDFAECEKILREHYNISNSSIITFFQLELSNNNDKALYNQIKYFTYDDKKQELDLSLCENIETKIHYMIKDNSTLDKSLINNFKNLGVDIFNIKDEFFTDLCYAYSDSNNDMILEDRIKYLYQNYSLCEEGCKYNNIDINEMSITCDCPIQGNFSSITTPLIFNQADGGSLLDSNIGVVKCYNLVFSFKNKFSNIGFIIFTILILSYSIFFGVLIKKGIKPIINFVFNEMKKYGYLNKKDEKIIEENEGIKNIQKANPKKKRKNKNLNLKDNKGKNMDIKMNIDTNEEDNRNEKENKESIITNLKLHNNFVISKHKDSKDSKKEKEKDVDNFGIIKININENIKKYMPKDSNQTLHNYTFEEAIKYDRRSIFRIFYIYLLSKQIIFHTFFQRSPLELFSLRITLFIFMLSCDLALNSLFYLNDNISKKYHYAKNLFLFAFSSNITIIIYSTLLSYFLITLMTKLSNPSNAIRNVFRKEEEKIKHKKRYKINDKIKKKIYGEILNIFRKYKIKLIILFVIEILLILFFWYFVTAFCHVYSSTQTSWLLDSFLSIISRFFTELIFAFLYAKLYQISVASNFETLYKIIIFLYDFT